MNIDMKTERLGTEPVSKLLFMLFAASYSWIVCKRSL